MSNYSSENSEPAALYGGSSVALTLLLMTAILVPWVLSQMPYVLQALVIIAVPMVYYLISLRSKFSCVFLAKTKFFSYFFKDLDEEQTKRQKEIDFRCYITLNILLLVNGLVFQFIYRWAEPDVSSFILAFIVMTYRDIECIKNGCSFAKKEITADRIASEMAVGGLGLFFYVFGILHQHWNLFQNGALTSIAVGIVVCCSLLVHGAAVFLKLRENQ